MSFGVSAASNNQTCRYGTQVEHVTDEQYDVTPEP